VAIAGDAAGNVDGDDDCSSEGGSGRGLRSSLSPSPRPASHPNPRPSTRTTSHPQAAAAMAIAATRSAASCRLLPQPLRRIIQNQASRSVESQAYYAASDPGQRLTLPTGRR
jgi:hypothetical protein